MIVLSAEADMQALGARLGAVLVPGDVVTLAGPLGAGKTVLARGLLRGAGFGGDVPSPSYPLVIPYDPPIVRLPVLHADLYRIDHVSALDELGLDEVRRDGVLIVEWPERASAIFGDALALTIAVATDGARRLTASVPTAWGGRWPLP